jgi:multisubunit Na+/H+ antiporter MnhB subunit
MTRVIARLLLGPTLVAAAAILVKGYIEPGDGFSAGVIAALGILVQYLAFGREEVERLLPIGRFGVVCFTGLCLTLVVAGIPLFLGDPALTQYPRPDGAEVIYVGTLELITAVAFDLGIFLLVLGDGVGTVRLVALRISSPEGSDTDKEDLPPEEEEKV